jgi:hypothetical protein
MDLIQELGKNFGLDTKQAENGVGALFNMLQSQAKPDAMSSILGAIPEASKWMNGAQDASGATAGGGLAGMVGGLLGGNAGGLGGLLAGASALEGVLGQLEKVGISKETALKFVPMVLGFVKTKMGDQAFAELSKQIPFLDTLTSLSQPTAAQGGGMGDILGKVTGMFK